MAVEDDIKELREAIRYLRNAVDSLKDKVSTDINQALSLSRDLHQKLSVLVAKLEARLETLEDTTHKLGYILQGNGTHKGVIGRVALLEKTTSTLEVSGKEQESTLMEIRTSPRPCDQHDEKIKELTGKISSLDKKTLELNTTAAALRGGWRGVGIVIAVLSGVTALILQLWRVFGS